MWPLSTASDWAPMWPLPTAWLGQWCDLCQQPLTGVMMWPLSTVSDWGTNVTLKMNKLAPHTIQMCKLKAQMMSHFPFQWTAVIFLLPIMFKHILMRGRNAMLPLSKSTDRTHKNDDTNLGVKHSDVETEWNIGHNSVDTYTQHNHPFCATSSMD